MLGFLSEISAVGCDAGGQTPKEMNESRVFGNVSLGLVLPDGSTASTVNFVVTRNSVEVRTGTMNVGSDGRASVTISGLDMGAGYHVRLTAARDTGSPCEGEADFTVIESQTTSVNVVLQCSELTVEGNITINGSFNICPKVTSTMAAPVTVAVGSSSAIAVAASDRDGDALSDAWTATGGTFSAPTASSTQYTCTSGGDKTLTVTFTDGPSRGCIRTATVNISCIGDSLDGGADGGTDSGADAGTDGGAPDGGGPGMTLSASMLAPGGSQTCWVLPNDGRLVCWGLDTFGTLGNGALNIAQTMASFVDSRRLPQGRAAPWKSVSINGGDLACGITLAGDAYCWGQPSGALGNGTSTSSETPRPIRRADTTTRRRTPRARSTWVMATCC